MCPTVKLRFGHRRRDYSLLTSRMSTLRAVYAKKAEKIEFEALGAKIKNEETLINETEKQFGD